MNSLSSRRSLQTKPKMLSIDLPAADHPCQHPENSSNNGATQKPGTRKLRPPYREDDRDDCRTEHYSPAPPNEE